jgi:hypothetical protein
MPTPSWPHTPGVVGLAGAGEDPAVVFETVVGAELVFAGWLVQPTPATTIARTHIDRTTILMVRLTYATTARFPRRTDCTDGGGWRGAAGCEGRGWRSNSVGEVVPPTRRAAASDGQLLRRGLALERLTLSWNVVGIVVLAWAAIAARSVALAGFGLDSLVEIGASFVVLWELTGTDESRQHRALRFIGVAFVALALYIGVQSVIVLATGYHPKHSALGIAWTAVTAVVMFGLAAAKSRTGRALANPVLVTEGRVTFVDGLLATSVLVGLVLNTTTGAWWADPLAGFVIVFYGLKEALTIFAGSHTD